MKLILSKQTLPSPEQDLPDNSGLTRCLQQKIRPGALLGLPGFSMTGKTSAIARFVADHHPSATGYYRIDESDNICGRFSAYLTAAAIHAGIPVSSSSRNPSPVFASSGWSEHDRLCFHEELVNLICAMEQMPSSDDSDSVPLLILDEINHIHEPALSAELKWFLNSFPPTCCILLLCDVPADHIKKTFSGIHRLKMLPQHLLALHSYDLIPFFNDVYENPKVSAGRLLSLTGGYAPVISCLLHTLQQSGSGKIPASHIFPSASSDQLLQNIFWDSLSPVYQDIVTAGIQFHTITPEFLREVLHIQAGLSDLNCMASLDLLRPLPHADAFEVPDFLVQLIRRAIPVSFPAASESLLQQAAIWQLDHHYLDSASRLLEWMNPRVLKKYMISHFRSLITPSCQMVLSQMLRQIPLDSSPEICFLHATGSLRCSQWETADRALDMLRQSADRFRIAGDSRSLHLCQEMLVNALFADPRISATQWLDCACHLAEDQKEPFVLYQICLNGSGLLDGIRDLSPLFACTQTQESFYENQWQTAFPSQLILFQMASVQYRLQAMTSWSSDQYPLLMKLKDKILHWLAACLATPDREQLLGMFSLIFLLSRRLSEDFPVEEYLMKLQEASASFLSPDDIDVLQMKAVFLHALKGEGSCMASCLSDVNDRFAFLSSDLHFICGRSCYLLGNYARAARHFSIAAESEQYGCRRILCTAARFGLAASLWHQQKKERALHLATEALSAGCTFFYVDPFLDYGRAGKELCHEFLRLKQLQAYRNISGRRLYHNVRIASQTSDRYLILLYDCLSDESRSLSIDQNICMPLSDREQQILHLMAAFMSNSEIASCLHIRPQTVKNHIFHIYQKFGVHSREQAIARARENHWL